MDYFTPEQANRLLPQVARLMECMIAKKAEWVRESEELKELATRGTSSQELARKKEQMSELSHALREGIRRIEGLGCMVRDVDMGLVDFPALRFGELVYLCWKAGEPEVGCWHGSREGYSKRKPLRSADIESFV